MHTIRSLGSTLDQMLAQPRLAIDVMPANWLNETRVWVPAVDVVEKKDAYLLFVELPGVSAAHTEIVFERNVLTIRGAKPSLAESDLQGARLLASERATGGFERSIRLPEYVDADAIDAQFTDGLLTVTVPKAQRARARRIEINPRSQKSPDALQN